MKQLLLAEPPAHYPQVSTCPTPLRMEIAEFSEAKQGRFAGWEYQLGWCCRHCFNANPTP
jgi:hypothetical protein